MKTYRLPNSKTTAIHAEIAELTTTRTCGCPLCQHLYPLATVCEPVSIETSTTTVVEHLPLCEVCSNPAEDKHGDAVACGTMTEGFSKCHVCGRYITWTWQGGNGFGDCGCGRAWKGAYTATRVQLVYLGVANGGSR